MGLENQRGRAGTKWGARRAEQFPHLGNYTLTPAEKILLGSLTITPQLTCSLLLSTYCRRSASRSSSVTATCWTLHIMTSTLHVWHTGVQWSPYGFGKSQVSSVQGKIHSRNIKIKNTTLTIHFSTNYAKHKIRKSICVYVRFRALFETLNNLCTACSVRATAVYKTMWDSPLHLTLVVSICSSGLKRRSTRADDEIVAES